MKKALFLILAFTLCLSLCACSGGSGFVGTYRAEQEARGTVGPSVAIVSEIILRSDGTGTYVTKAAEDEPRFLNGGSPLKEGDVLIKVDFKWKEVDGLLKIAGKGKSYIVGSSLMDIYHIDQNGQTLSFNKTYEMVGDRLCERGSDDWYQKVG